jgi:Leucine-rich repeat (LRR) protein
MIKSLAIFIASLGFGFSLLAGRIYLHGDYYDSEETIIDLKNRKISELSPKIGDFTHLKTLILSSNNLAVLPDQLKNLKKLEVLDLANNEFEYFPRVVCELEAIKILSIRNNNLSSLPREMGDLSKLELLSLPATISSIPQDLEKLIKLKSLSIFSNIYHNARSFKNNEWLLRPFVDINGLTISFDYNTLPSSEWLEIKDKIGTKLKIGDKWINMDAEVVDISEVDLSEGDINWEIGKFTTVKELILRNNNLSNFPTNIAKLVTLNRLFFENNNLKTIPAEVAELGMLETLVLSSNPLDSLPLELANLKKLKTLHISAPDKSWKSPGELAHTALNLLLPFADMSKLQVWIDGRTLSSAEWERVRTLLPVLADYRAKGQKVKSLLDLDFGSIGIGGLDEQIEEIIKEAIGPLITGETALKAYGIKAQKGILLSGPPGTGKTLLARKIGQMLPDADIQIVNGPELNASYVGETERNIRELFNRARKKPKKLHVIIFDEIDGFCAKRNPDSRSNFNNVVVTQLLTEIDGVSSASNVLVIGITNRPECLDEALTREGRLGCHLKMPLPNEAGRKQILDIYLSHLQKNNLAPDIDTAHWASHLEGFSGAQIEELVNQAKRSALFSNWSRQPSDVIFFDIEPEDLVPVTANELFASFAKIKRLPLEVCKQQFPALIAGRACEEKPKLNPEDQVTQALRQLNQTLEAAGAGGIAAVQDFLRSNEVLAACLKVAMNRLERSDIDKEDR